MNPDVHSHERSRINIVGVAPDDDLGQLLTLLRYVSVLFTAVLFFVSAPLWTQGGELFPQVPFFAVCRSASIIWDRVAFCVVLGSLGLILMPGPRCQAAGCWCFVLASSVLVVLDQHRLQPWLQQLVLLCLFGVLLPKRETLKFARWLLISIYLFSALSKIDFAFLQTLGHQFSAQALSFVGLEFKELPDLVRWGCAWSFPIGELLIGIGLLVARTRRLAASVAIVLHVALFLILGPFGLKHQWGVLCWNLFFIAQVVILFLLRPGNVALESKVERPRIQTGVCFALLFLPVLEPFGLYDHWPAWQLYAPRNSRVAISILDERAGQLPADMLPYLSSAGGDFGIWRPIDLDAWSLDVLHVPNYPQGRFQIGASLALWQACDLTGVRVDYQEASDRWTGKREQQVFANFASAKEMASERYRLNALPRYVSVVRDGQKRRGGK